MIRLGEKDKLYQWDVDRFVEVSGCRTVHFAYHGSDDDALVVEVKTLDDGRNIAEIPNLLLQKPLDINVWTFDDGHTLEYKRFKVIGRPKPSGYVYRPTEVLTVESIKTWVLEQIENLEKATDYNLISNKPSINGHTLQGDVLLEDIGIIGCDDAEIDKLFD